MKNKFLICIEIDDESDLDYRKVYRAIPDADAAKHGMVRVIDASGEDYLYPASCFAEIDLPPKVAARLRDAERTPKRAPA